MDDETHFEKIQDENNRIIARMILREEYTAHIERSRDGGNWFLFFRDYLSIMTIEEAVVVQSVCNLGKKKSKDGWILCTMGYLKECLYLERRAQDRILKSLVKKGFIQTSMRGIPGRRHVKIDVLFIEEKIQERLSTPACTVSDKLHCTVSDKYNRPKGLITNNSAVDQPSAALTAVSGGLDNTTQEDSMKPFIGPSKEPKKPPREVDLARARKLRDAVSTLGKITRHPNIKRWAKEFKALSKFKEEATIDTILDFYTKNIKTIKYPGGVYSATTFCSRFGDLEDQYVKHLEKNPVITISPYADEIANSFKHWNWPASFPKDKIPLFTQQCLDGVAAIQKALLPFAEDKKSKYHSLAKWLVDERLHYPGPFVTAWVAWFNQQIANWKEWSGNYQSWLIKPMGQKWLEQGQRWVKDYNGRPKEWIELMEEIA